MYAQPDNRVNLTSVGEFVEQYRNRLARNTSRIFVVLMLLQWAGAILTALIVSPRSWSGTASAVHVHVWAAILLGGMITVVPVGLALMCPTQVLTHMILLPGKCSVTFIKINRSV